MGLIRRVKDKIAMDFITRYLAKFIDAFKVGNPKAFIAVQFVIGLLVYSMDHCIDLISFCGTDTFGNAANIIEALLIGLGFTLGSRTTSILSRPKA